MESSDIFQLWQRNPVPARTKGQRGKILSPRERASSKNALDQLRGETAPARRNRRLGVIERNHIAGEAIVHEHGDAVGFELEAGAGGIVADGGGHRV